MLLFAVSSKVNNSPKGYKELLEGARGHMVEGGYRGVIFAIGAAGNRLLRVAYALVTKKTFYRMPELAWVAK